MSFHNFYRTALMGLLLATLATLPIHNTVQASPIGLIDSNGAICDLDGVSRQNPAQVPLQLPTKLQALLQVNDPEARNFGSAVAISSDGNTLLTGAHDASYTLNGNPVDTSGVAYIFIRNGYTWSQRPILIPDDGAPLDNFGHAVALSADGNTALIGADHKDSAETTDSGAAYVFTRSGNSWALQTKITASDKATGDYFGHAVALSADGNLALIGATGRDESGTTDNGAVYIFARSGTTWVQQDKLVAADKANQDAFGHALTLSTDGTTALIGTYNTNAIDRGAFYTFAYNGTTWIQQSRVHPAGSPASFGYSIALSTDSSTVLIGSFEQAVNVFIRAGADWVQQAQLPINGFGNGTNFVRSVALSGDGNTALVAIRVENALCVPSYNREIVYTRNASLWTYRTNFGNDLWGNTPPDTNKDLALSENGDTAIIGGGYGNFYPAVFVYTPPENVPTATPTITPTPFPKDNVGLYKDGRWYLRNANSSGAPDITVSFGGDPSDLPVVGDWNGDGVDTIGVYRGSTGFFFLSDSNTTPSVNYTVLFGNPGDTPFAGRWTVDMSGNGIGVYRDSNGILYQRKFLTSGFDDFFAVYGNPGDQAVAGDWDRNAFDSIGIYRSSNQTWFLTNNSRPSGITFSDVNFVWDIGAGAPVIGDWDADARSTVGYYLTDSGVFVLHPSITADGIDNVFSLGITGGKPVAGKWVVGSRPPVANVIHPIVGAAGSNSNDNGRTD